MATLHHLTFHVPVDVGGSWQSRHMPATRSAEVITESPGSAPARHPSATPFDDDEAWQAAYGPMLDELTDAHLELNRWEARRSRLLSELAQRIREDALQAGLAPEWEIESFAVEIVASLHISERQFTRLLDSADAVLTYSPRSQEQWESGRIQRSHADIIATTVESVTHHGSVDVTSDEIQRMEDRLIQTALERTPAELRRLAKRLEAQLLDTDTVRIKARQAREQRKVCLNPTDDGMAWLQMLLPAVDAVAAFDRTRDIARRLAKDENGHNRNDETRTLTQIQSDVARDLLIFGWTTDTPTAQQSAKPPLYLEDPSTHSSVTRNVFTYSSDSTITAASDPQPLQPHHSMGIGRGIQAHVTVTVPVLSLLGTSKAVTDLAGYGPIDGDTARELCAEAPSISRILTDPLTGIALALDRKRYRPPAELARWVKTRDRTCRAPGCTRPAHRCEIDHTVDWQYGGTTDHQNLASLCRKHHMLKHRTKWKIHNLGDGTLHWQSPSGRVIQTRPDEYEIPHTLHRPTPARIGTISLAQTCKVSANTDEAEEPDETERSDIAPF